MENHFNTNSIHPGLKHKFQWAMKSANISDVLDYFLFISKKLKKKNHKGQKCPIQLSAQKMSEYFFKVDFFLRK